MTRRRRPLDGAEVRRLVNLANLRRFKASPSRTFGEEATRQAVAALAELVEDLEARVVELEAKEAARGHPG